MSFARKPALLIAAGMLACSAAAMADVPTVKRVDNRPLSFALAGKATRAATVVEVHTAFAEGDRVGTLQSGAACSTKADREWSDLIQERVASELPRVFQEEMSKAGDKLAAPMSMDEPLRVQAFLNDLDIQVCQAAAGAWQGGFYVQVSWQVTSPESGQLVYQASTEGSFMLNEAQRMPTSAGLREAFAVAVRNLLADRRFASMLQSAEPRRVAMSH